MSDPFRQGTRQGHELRYWLARQTPVPTARNRDTHPKANWKAAMILPTIHRYRTRKLAWFRAFVTGAIIGGLIILSYAYMAGDII